MDPLSETDVIQSESPENFVVIFEILPIDKEWKSNEITYCNVGRVVVLTAGMLLIKLTFLPHGQIDSTRTLQLCFVSPNKIRIQFLFHSHSVVDYLKYC